MSASKVRRSRTWGVDEIKPGDLLALPVALYLVVDARPLDYPDPEPVWAVWRRRIGDTADIDGALRREGIQPHVGMRIHSLVPCGPGGRR